MVTWSGDGGKEARGEAVIAKEVFEDLGIREPTRSDSLAMNGVSVSLARG